MTEPTSPEGFIWTYPAVVDYIHDGDSFAAHVWFSHRDGDPHYDHIRIEGINAIELSQKFGPEARDTLANILPNGTRVTLEHRKAEKFGRLLARVIRQDGFDVGDYMLKTKASDGVTSLAVPMA